MATLQPSALPSNPYDLLARVVRRHPFFLGALLIHGAVLWLVSHLHSEGQAEAVLRNNQAQIQAHTQPAAQHGMRRRVDSLKAMKSLMERIDRAQAEPDEAMEAALSPEPGASQSAARGSKPARRNWATAATTPQIASSAPSWKRDQSRTAV